MKLKALRLHNVRRFAGRGVAIEGIGEGVNVLCAPNEHGKSTCFDALHALFFQAHTGMAGAVRSLQPYSGGSPLVEADIETEDGRFRISKKYLGGRRATVVDLAGGRVVAQADEAERFIGRLVRGGSGGPAGLLWVRQGVVGFEERTGKDGDKQAREDLLSSVQGEVEAVTGGRRMVEVAAACTGELNRLITETGRPKTGGPLHAAMEQLRLFSAEEERLARDVETLHEALEGRRRARIRLAEIEDPEAVDARKARLAEAEAAFEAARSHREILERAEAQAAMLELQDREARARLDDWRAKQARLAELSENRLAALGRRDQALADRAAARDREEKAHAAVETAETDEREARELLQRLERAMKVRETAERRARLADNLRQAEEIRHRLETDEAMLKSLSFPRRMLDDAEALELEIATLQAAANARAPVVRMTYFPGAEGKVLSAGEPLPAGEDLPLPTAARLEIEGIGILSVTPGRSDTGGDRLAAARERHRSLLAAIGVPDLAGARRRMEDAERLRGDNEVARQKLAVLSPDGMGALRAELARLDAESNGAIEEKGDPDAVRAALEEAGHRVAGARQAARASRPLADAAEKALAHAAAALAAVEAEMERLEEALGPPAERPERENRLVALAAETAVQLAPARETVEALRRQAPDLAAAEAALRRHRSVAAADAEEAAGLRERIADLSGFIAAHSQAAVEEALREAVDRRTEAEAQLARLKREVAVLQRLRTALDAARSAARDQYFEPVLRELRPLIGLLFDDASVTFDEATLLPQAVERDGLVEDIDRLSGGMREQLAVLTRLAFARLLAREGHPAPVVLDDALVYSDDDRIERMFDALHRQALAQQVIVFTCRQRAFANLGGNRLAMTDWRLDE